MAEEQAEKKRLSGEAIVALIAGGLLVLLLLGPLTERGIVNLLAARDSAAVVITPLDAAITLTARQITIVNQNAFNWENVKVTLDANTTSGITPFCKLHHLAAGESITLDLIDFMTSPTQRFNAEDIPVHSAGVSATTPFGVIKYP